MDTLGGSQGLLCISESGLYRLIITSRKPQADQFQTWLAQEVLPSIRKTGSYAVELKPKTALELAKEQVALLERLELLELENAMLNSENNLLSEAVDDLFSYSSIIRVAKFNNVSESCFNWRTLLAASKAVKSEVKKVPCPRFEYKNLYSHDAWRLAYPSYELPETTTLTIVAAS